MQHSASCLAAICLLLISSCGSSQAQPVGGAPSTSFLGALQAGVGAGGNATGGGARAAICNGTTPANVIIESVTPVGAAGDMARVVLRNTGGQAANITGWRLFTGDNSSTAGGAGGARGAVLYIADAARCKPNGTLPSGQALVFMAKSEQNPCGFSFNLSNSGTVTLADYNDQAKSVMSWTDASPGTQIHVPITGSTALRVPAGSNVLDVLRSLGSYDTFLLALQATGLDKQLTAASDPNYTGPQLPLQQFVLDLPWWFSAGQTAAAQAPPPAPTAEPAAPPAVGIPPAGPYTILAPTDEAFDTLLTNLGGANGKLPLDALLRQPTLKDILLYHIIPGRYTSPYLRNNTAIYTAKGVEIVPIVDGCQTEGKIALHDSCVDKPTGDNFTCAEQRAFGKCDFPFMVSPLAAQWQGGFCQRTCQRCDCSPGSGVQCSIVQNADVDASNGVIHGISRVLFPPPVFTKEQAVRDAVAYNESLARNQSLGLPVQPGMTGLNELPGAAPGAGVAAPGAGAALPATPGGTTPTTPGNTSVTAANGAANMSAPGMTAGVTAPAAPGNTTGETGTTAAASPSPAAGGAAGGEAGGAPAPAPVASPAPGRRLRGAW